MSAPTADRARAQVIRWEEPPSPDGRGRPHGSTSRYVAVADALRAEPGRWALIEVSEGRTTSLAFHIRMGAIEPFAPGGDFDAVSRRVNGKTAIYARYVGDGAA